jgi:hypothetical protein
LSPLPVYTPYQNDEPMNEHPPTLRSRADPECGTSAYQAHPPWPRKTCGFETARSVQTSSASERDSNPVRLASPPPPQPFHLSCRLWRNGRGQAAVSSSVSTSLCVATLRPFTRFAPGIVTQNCPFSALKTERVFVRTLPINELRVCQLKAGQLCGDIGKTAVSLSTVAPIRTYAHQF